MQQYFEIKDKYREYILMYRLGDFYEMFFDDAKVVSAELDLTLTGRDCGEETRAPMCGVPYHAVEGYIGKLEAAALPKNDKETRIAALTATRLIKQRPGVELLMAYVNDPDVDIRRAAGKALLMNGTKDITDALLNYCEQEEDEEVAKILKEAAISAKDRTPRI